MGAGLKIILGILFLGSSTQVCAEEIKVAVAANFAEPLKRLVADFEKVSTSRLVLIPGATATLASQIRNGAPFQIFLSADQETAEALIKEGWADQASAFIYAKGALVLWSPTPGLVDPQAQVLKTGTFKHLALAKPELAPYGKAAVQYLKKQNLWDSLQSKIVWGQNITQAFQFVATGNADLGFIALSQIQKEGEAPKGSFLKIPTDPEVPLQQEAVVLKAGQNKLGVKEFLDYLKTSTVQRRLNSMGYE